MKKELNILLINGSPRGERSLSRQLASSFMDSWRANGITGTIQERDVGRNPPPFVTEDWVAAAFTPPADRTSEMKQALAYSDSAIAELKKADVLVLATPMHNYGLPAATKAWVDQIIRVNETFSFDLGRGDFPIEPTLSGKRMVLLTSAGEFGFEPSGIRAWKNHLHPHVETIAHYLGVSQSWSAAIEYQEFGDQRFEQSKARAFSKLPEIAEALLASYGSTDEMRKNATTCRLE
jgi:FMN-dependent NADH-azoreductase